MTQKQALWLGGMFDGDGSISGSDPNFPHIEFELTHRPTIKYIQRLIGDSNPIHTIEREKKEHRRSFRYTIGAIDSVITLSEFLLDYSQCKQAELIYLLRYVGILSNKELAEGISARRESTFTVIHTGIDRFIWFCGLFDAEGSIFIGYNRSNYRLEVVTVITNKEVLTEFCKWVPAKIERIPRVRLKDGSLSKQAYRVKVSATHECLQLLKQMQPHLVTKRDQCELAIQYLEEVKIPNYYKRRSPELRALEGDYHKRMNWLNRVREYESIV